MTLAHIQEPHTTLVWYAAHAIDCIECGYPVRRYFHHTHNNTYRVWAEHRTFGFIRDCLLQEVRLHE